MFSGGKGQKDRRKTMNSYEAKQEMRRMRYREQADKAQKEYEDRHNQARAMASVIPFGQPILVGHHSEKRDRNYRDRIHNTFGKAFHALDKARHYEDKAASVGTGGISGDDPDAVAKLRAELESLERGQQSMKDANAAIRRGKTPEERIAALLALGYKEEDARSLLQPDFAGRVGFPSYSLSNQSANMRRIRERIAALEKLAAREAREEKNSLYEYREDKEENRVMFLFDDKPCEEIRAVLKSRGFKWSPTRGAWVRQLTSAALYAAAFIKESLAMRQGREAGHE
jgi:hypothetical protein